MLLRAAYRLLLWLALPLALLKLWWRGRREPGYREDIAGRLGIYAAAAPAPLIWVHAVSVGETRAAQPLIEALMQAYPRHQLLLTQMTASGREAARQLYAHLCRVHLAWLPYDQVFTVRRFLRHFRPQLGVIMETELWFNLVHECAASGVPLLLANARLSARSARGYALTGGLMRRALGQLAAIGAQTSEDAQRLQHLGAPATRLSVTGNLKFDVLPEDASGLAALLRKRFGGRKVLLAASLREGEEDLLLDALEAAGGLADNALLVMVPRHPQRFEEVAQLLARRGLRFMRRSAECDVTPDCPVVLGDSMGEMAAYYAACDCAFVGGSLLEYGGQNLIEACAAGVPILIGPHTYNFAQVAEVAVAAGAAVRVSDAAAVFAEANRQLQDEGLRKRMGEAGLNFHRLHRGAAARTLDLCRRLLPPPPYPPPQRGRRN